MSAVIRRTSVFKHGTDGEHKKLELIELIRNGKFCDLKRDSTSRYDSLT